MPRRRPELVAIAAIVLLPAVAAAQTVYDGFNYPPGSPPVFWNGGTGWSPNTPFWNITSGGVYGVFPGSLPYTAANGPLVTSGGFLDTQVVPAVPVGNRLTRAVATDLASSNGGDWWMSFLVRKNTAATGDYGGITVGNGGGSTADVGRLFIGEAGSGTTWGLERAGGGNAAASNFSATPGQTALLVVRLQINNAGYDTATLYVNPTDLGGAAPATPSAALSTLDFNPGGIQVSLLNIDFGAAAYSFDEIRIGTTYASVTPVPEPVSVLGVAAGLMGVVRLVRRRFTA